MQDQGYETEMYFDREPAATAVERLHGLGYGPGDISVMMSDKTRERAFGELVHAKASEGVAAGATIGGVLGAIVVGLGATGLIIGTGGAAAPLIAGPLAAALAGLGAGAATGGVVGGLVGLGIGASEAKRYERGLSEGGILVAVIPKSQAHREDVRRAMAYDPTVTGGGLRRNLDDPDVEYAGEMSAEKR
jgi:hypothetical protein